MKQNTPGMVDKISSLMLERFGAQIKIQPQIPFIADELVYPAKTWKCNQYWYFPVYRDQMIVGTAVISGVSLQDCDLSDDLKQWIELYIEAYNFSIQAYEHNENIQKIETYLIAQEEIPKPLSNVISLQQRRSKSDTLQMKNRSHLRAGFAQSYLIESTDMMEAFKLAQEIHHISGRFAFISLTDLVPVSASSFLELGDVTIWIKELAELTHEHQEACRLHLEQKPEVNNSHFIACSQYSSQDLIEKFQFCPELLKELQKSFIKMKKSFSDYKRMGLFELL